MLEPNQRLGSFIRGDRMPAFQASAPQLTITPTRPGMVWIPSGVFRMGESAFYPEEGPVRERWVDGFWIDRHPVTNGQFARFVAATQYVSSAEWSRLQGSMVFRSPSYCSPAPPSETWWYWVPGADWRHPSGPHSGIDGLVDHPVVHVTVADALAYCAWAGSDLPTEAEWEYAARGWRESAIFTWGNEERPGGRFLANTWQGHFPYHNNGEDGFLGTSPVGSFPANGFGLLDMAGNIWEWTRDPYTVPAGGDVADTTHHVIKGGSYLSAPSNCFRYRPAARQPHPVALSACDLGFRVVMRPRPEPG